MRNYERHHVPEGFAYCKLCESTLPRDAFGPSKSRSTGIQAYCRSCTSAYRNAKYREAHPVKPKPEPPTELECNFCHRVFPISEFNLRNVGRRCKECKRQKERAQRASIPAELRRAKSREDYANNIERRREIGRNHYRKHIEEYRAAGRTRAVAKRLKERLELLEAYGGHCSCCGEREQRFLTLEHINHDGKEHRALVGSVNVYRDLKRRGWPKDGYTLYCWNCNMATRRGDPCPHRLQAS